MKKISILLISLLTPIFVNAQENEYIDVSEQTKYYKTIDYIGNYDYQTYGNNILSNTIEITEEEYNKADSTMKPLSSTLVETTYKKLTTTIQTNGNYYRYKASLEWKNMPKIRSYDTIAIGHYESVKIRGGVNFTQRYCISSDCKTLTTYYEEIFSKGAAATFKVPAGDFTLLKQEIYFDVEKNVDATILTQKVAGDYAHATKTISASNARKYEINLLGIQFKSGITSYYDEINPATVNYSCNW